MVNVVDRTTRVQQYALRASHVIPRTPTTRSACLQFHLLDNVVVPHLEALHNASVDILASFKVHTILNAWSLLRQHR